MPVAAARQRASRVKITIGRLREQRREQRHDRLVGERGDEERRADRQRAPEDDAHRDERQRVPEHRLRERVHPEQAAARARPRASPPRAPVRTARTKSPLRATVAVASRNQSTGRKPRYGSRPTKNSSTAAAGEQQGDAPQLHRDALRPASAPSFVAGDGASKSTSVRREKSADGRRPGPRERACCPRDDRLDAADRNAARIDAVDAGRLDQVAAGDRRGRRRCCSGRARRGRRPARRRALRSARCARPRRPTRRAGAARARRRGRPSRRGRRVPPAPRAGSPATTPSAEPAPIRTLCDSGALLEEENRHAADDAGKRRARAEQAPVLVALERLGAQAEELPLAGVELAAQALVLRAGAEERDGRLDGAGDAVGDGADGRRDRRRRDRIQDCSTFPVRLAPGPGPRAAGRTRRGRSRARPRPGGD